RVGRTWQVDLAIFADDATALVDEDAGVVAPKSPTFFGQLGIAEMKSDLEPLGLLEQRPRLGAGHLAFVEGIDLRLVAQHPTRKERRQRQLGVDDQIATHAVRLAHQLDQPAYHLGTAFVAGDRPQLRAADRDVTRHRLLRTVSRWCAA